MDLELFVGGGMWTDMGNASQYSNPISPGFFAQAGAALTFDFFDNFFLQLRGSGRFYFSDESSSVSGVYSPAPLGNFDIGLIGGVSVK